MTNINLTAYDTKRKPADTNFIRHILSLNIGTNSATSTSSA